MKRNFTFLLLSILANSKAIAQGCSQCKLMAEQGIGIEDSTFASNLNFGILYLMAFPYLILLFLFRKQLVHFFKSFLSPSKSPQ